MKKSYLLFMLVATMAVLTQCAVSQKIPITATTATNDKGYKIINKDEPITIYKFQHPSHSPKEAEKYAPKYFFTTKSSDVLQELTKENLKKAFPNEHPFHDALDAQFKEDKELINYDDFHKMNKLNHIYMSTVKQ